MRRRRRVRPLVVHRLELDPADELIERRRAPHVLAGEPRRHEAERRGGLRRRDVLVGQRARRHRRLGDGQDRLAAAPVEHVELALLGRLHERRHLGAADLEIDQRRLRRHVAVPEIVVNALERPAQLAGREVEGDDGAGESLDRRAAVRAELVGRQVAERKVDDAELLVDARRRPRIRRVGRIRSPGASGAVGSGLPRSQLQTSWPSATSKARITPDGLSTDSLSLIEQPMTMRFRVTTGGEVSM